MTKQLNNNQSEHISQMSAHEPGLAVQCKDVHKSFPIVQASNGWRILLGLSHSGDSVEALKGISLSVPKGKILGVLGRNGAGKSTLLRVLAGVYSATSGVVSIKGNVASLFELGGLGTRFITGREYAERLLMFQGVRGKLLQELINEVQDFSELGSFFDRRIYTYSSGMAARLYFAVATAIQKEVYLIDELLSVGDEHFQAKCWRRISDRLNKGASGVLVTHDWSAVIKLCEKSVILDNGSIILAGQSDKVVASYLNLPKPDLNFARFDNLPEVYSAESGKDFRLRIPLTITSEDQLEFAFSIELLRLGIGWEILILSDFEQVTSSRGNNIININVPNLPLAAGDYSLNLFLRRRLADGSKETCDSRSWTGGNGLSLEVRGETSSTAFHLPVRWKLGKEIFHAQH